MIGLRQALVVTFGIQRKATLLGIGGRFFAVTSATFLKAWCVQIAVSII